VIGLLQEMHFAARLAARQRAFAGAAIATLAVGIASATAVFTVVNGVLVEPLPYQEADRIVHLVSHNLEAGAETRGWVMSLPYFTGLRERATSLSAIGDYDSFSNITRQRLTAVVEGADGSARLPGTRMSPVLSRCCWQRSASTRSWRTRWADARARSARGWRSARASAM
jgi:hypothetical protein